MRSIDSWKKFVEKTRDNFANDPQGWERMEELMRQYILNRPSQIKSIEGKDEEFIESNGLFKEFHHFYLYGISGKEVGFIDYDDK